MLNLRMWMLADFLRAMYAYLSKRKEMDAESRETYLHRIFLCMAFTLQAIHSNIAIIPAIMKKHSDMFKFENTKLWFQDNYV